MKLLSKTSLLIITASIFIFWVGNIIFFFVTREMINKQINSDLMTRMSEVMTLIKGGEGNPENLALFDEISISETVPDRVIPPTFSDTVLYNTAQQKYVAHRALRFTLSVNNEINEVSIYKSLLSSDKLIERVTLLSVLMLISFIGVIFVLNRYISM